MTRKEYNNCVDIYSNALFVFILKSIGDREMTDDIVQESYISLWEHADDICFEKAKSYLFTTAYRRMIDFIRRCKKVDRLRDNPELVEWQEPEQEPEHEYFDRSSVIEMALSKLPRVQRDVILLRDYQGCSYQEIAEITSLHESQVKVYLFRARHKLRTLLRGEI